MIEVTIKRASDKTITSFTMSGHANSGPHGQDIVCAGASATAIGTVNAIEELLHFQPHVDAGGEGGYLDITLPAQLDHETFEKAQLLLEAMIVTLRSIEQEYSQYIVIDEQQ